MALPRVVAVVPIVVLGVLGAALGTGCDVGSVSSPDVPGGSVQQGPRGQGGGSAGGNQRLDGGPIDGFDGGTIDFDEGPDGDLNQFDEGVFLDSGPVLGPPPDFGTTITQASSPPPISGGTLLVTKAGDLAVAADPDRDQVYLVDLTTRAVTTIPLVAGDQPGRVVEDAARRVHVAARSGGVVVTIDLGTKQLTARRAVCGAPRGIAYDSAGDDLYVACATGELVSLPAGGGAVTKTVVVDRDLRDVIVPGGALADGGSLIVSRMKTAELLTVGTDGAVLSRTPPSATGTSEPTTAWRTIALPAAAGGQIVMVHQRASSGMVSTQPGGYTSGAPSCDTSIVESTVTLFADATTTPVAGPPLNDVVLPVDVAATTDGSVLAVVGAGNGKTAGLGSVFVFDRASYAAPSNSSCATFTEQGPFGQATAIAFDTTGRLVVQAREPAQLYIIDTPLQAITVAPTPILLSTVTREDTGHSIFHSNSGGFIACASCHAEGLEDGHVWQLDATGGRRTQSLRGTLSGTAPYHWEGNQQDIPALTQEVYVGRMSGIQLATDQVAALQAWLFALPAPPAPPVADPVGVQLGQALFGDPQVGCSTCHSGPKLTNNATLSVNTGGTFQVPSLVGVAWRAPFLHDGCAATLADRFGICTDGVSHGQTKQLTPEQIGDLIEYLQTL
jgi:mono/diheme cytochrome c family protein